MKKKIIALGLVCVMLFGCLLGCASQGKTLMTLEKDKITLNQFYLYLSRLKGYLSTADAYGTSAYDASFWDTLMDATNGQTYGEYYRDQIKENVKNYLAALALFRERGLKLPDETVKAIDDELQEIIDLEWNGSKSEFNAKLAEYGANYDVLREVKIIEAKISYLRQDLFGTDGSLIGANLKENYYQQNYRRYKQLFFYTYNFVTVKDENGEERIVTDSEGNPKKEAMTESEIRQVIDRANLTLEKTVEHNFTLFDTLLYEKNAEGTYVNNQDVGSETYTNGYYLTAVDNALFPEVQEALFEMEVGEIRLVYSDHGAHIIMRYENDEGAYSNTTNADFFNHFVSNLEDILLTDYLREYVKRVTVDEEVFATVDIKHVKPNTHY